VSNEHYPTSSFNSIEVFDALATTVDLKVLGQILILFKRTMSVSLHRLIRASMGSFPAMFVDPSRNREYLDTFLHSVEVVTYTHERSKLCCTTGHTFPSILLFV
jgi:hypothetical protein